MKYSSIRHGETYYTVTRGKMGNTTVSTVFVHTVKVISMDAVKETVVASWNGNKPKTFYASHYAKWRKTKPVTIKSAMGSVRLATRAEIAVSKLE